MNIKTVGIIAMLCAPFLFIDSLTAIPNTNTRQTGVFDLLYMTGWMCSLFALQQMQFLGATKSARVVFIIQVVLLSLAQMSNIWVIIAPASEGTLFRILDSSWPLSNICMLITGITAVAAHRLKGWQRYVPLAAGLWFPVTIIIVVAKLPMWAAGIYSFIAYMLLGLSVYIYSHQKEKQRANAHTYSVA